MRTIKFRAWDIKEKVMHKAGFLIDSDGNIYDNTLCDGEVQSYSFGSRQIILIQFTERKDKNKKEMYEGDIVKWINNFEEENTGWIRYTKPIAGFYIVLIKGSYIPFYTGSTRNFAWGDLEIIGNIYENPDLLGKEHDILW